jgi:hypothetical protein
MESLNHGEGMDLDFVSMSYFSTLFAPVAPLRTKLTISHQLDNSTQNGRTNRYRPRFRY